MFNNDTARLIDEYRGELLDLTHYGYILVVNDKGEVLVGK